MPEWNLNCEVDKGMTDFSVTDGSRIAYYATYPNITYQSRRRRLWNWLRRKGSTKAVIVLDVDAVGRQLAEVYGLEWKK